MEPSKTRRLKDVMKSLVRAEFPVRLAMLVAGVFLLEGVTKMLEASGGDGMFAKAEIDFQTAAIALFTLVLAGVLSAILPATKAAKVDPIVALQDE